MVLYQKWLRRGFFLLALFSLFLVPVRPAFSENPVVGSEVQEDFDRKYDRWVSELQAAYLANPSERVLPESMYRRTSVDRLRNEIFAKLVEWKIKRTTSSGNAAPSLALDTIRPKAAQALKGLKNRWYSPLFTGSAFDTLEQVTSPQNGLDIGLGLTKLNEYATDYYADIERYKREFGSEFFSEVAISRGALNVVSMRIFADLNGVKQPRRDAMNAIALLHPVTDEVIDSGNFDPALMQKISDLLDGKKPVASTAYEKLVFHFVDSIFEAYPKEEHPLLAWAMKKLHHLQLQSVKQREGMTTADLLKTSFYKGGLATLIAGYLSGESRMSNAQQTFFFKSGCAFQLLDDLADIKEDTKDKIETMWTRALREKGSIEEPLFRLLQTERVFEDEMARTSDGTPGLEKVKAIYPAGFKATLVKSLNKNEDVRVKRAIGQVAPYFSVSPATLGRLYNQALQMMPSDCTPIWARLIRANELY